MKASINRIILGSVLLTTATTACVNDDVTASSGDKVAVQISASTPVTRAADNSWGENDVIGISMLTPDGTAVISSYSNYNYITPNGNSNFTPTAPEQIMYFPVDDSEVTFKAYYPYSSTLPADMKAPLNVTDQNSLPELDFMTAEHLSGNSAKNPNVKLHFYHRMAKVLFDITTEDNSISLEGCKLVAKGLKTTGTYNIMKEEIAVDAASTGDITIPTQAGKAQAIFLPREAGTEVSFEITTANGGVYTAKLQNDVPFKAGYRHTLHINLRKTIVTVSATIEQWMEGPETHSNVIQIVTGLKDSEGVVEGDTLRLFLKKDQADYVHAAKFTYNADNKWTTDTPIYWDDITTSPAYFIGTTVKNVKLNDTQMDDILLSDETAVKQYTGINLELQHIGSKAIVLLQSTNGTFSKAELDGATVTFPGYKYTGSVNAKGEFVINETIKDIKTESGIAIFPPQTIKKGDVIAIVTISGRKYEVKAEKEDFIFGKGTASKLTFDLSKAEVKISTQIVAWRAEEHMFEDIKVGSAHLNDNGGDLKNDDKLYIYTGTNDTERVQQGEPFTYSTTTNSWSYGDPAHPLHWGDIPSIGNIYASITRPAMSSDASANQLPDYILATPIINNGGADNTALNFQMNHSTAKVIVVLKSNTYGTDELKKASVILPSYKTGAKMVNGLFVPGTTTANITLPNLTKDASKPFVSDAAYLQPQEIAANTVIVKIVLNTATTNKEYEAKMDSELIYEAGKATTLIVTLEKTDVQISTDVIDWSDKPNVNIEGMFFEVGGGSTDGFNVNDKIGFYQVNAQNKTTGNNNTGTIGMAGTTMIISLPANKPWYRDDFTEGSKILATYPQQTIATEVESFAFNNTGDYSAANDLLTAATTIKANANIGFDFVHALSKLTVNIKKGTGFSDDELKDLTVKINNIKVKGNVNVATGVASTTNDVPTNFAPTQRTTPTTGAVASFDALVMPQIVKSATTVITVTLSVGGKDYYAQLEADATFEGGKNHIYNITMNKTGISLSVAIKDWVVGAGDEMEAH